MTFAGRIGLAVLAGLLVVSVLGDSITGRAFDAQDPDRALQGPSPEHPMGTDALGRDLGARIAEGARISLIVAVGSTLLALALGIVYGAIAGWVGGRVDGVLMRAVDVVYALPDILVIVLLTEVLGSALSAVPDVYRRLAALVLALGGVGWVAVARLVRGLVLQAREEAWVESARAVGASSVRILTRHVLPNVSAAILVTATFRIPAAILAESTLSFIGLGMQPPFASWGVLAADGFAAMRSYPHLIVFPSLAILVSLLGFQLVGESLRRIANPRLL